MDACTKRPGCVSCTVRSLRIHGPVSPLHPIKLHDVQFKWPQVQLCLYRLLFKRLWNLLQNVAVAPRNHLPLPRSDIKGTEFSWSCSKHPESGACSELQLTSTHLLNLYWFSIKLTIKINVTNSIITKKKINSNSPLITVTNYAKKTGFPFPIKVGISHPDNRWYSPIFLSDWRRRG